MLVVTPWFPKSVKKSKDRPTKSGDSNYATITAIVASKHGPGTAMAETMTAMPAPSLSTAIPGRAGSRIRRISAPRG